jgi:hypothetical protein
MDCSPFRSSVLSNVRKWTLAVAGALVIGSLASPASAAREPSARLIACGDESCLLVTGYRMDPAEPVSINGRGIEVEGQRRWRARVPVETVRLWSEPHARTIEVSLGDSESGTSVDLPIGLLGNVTDLAALEVRVR